MLTSAYALAVRTAIAASERLTVPASDTSTVRTAATAAARSSGSLRSTRPRTGIDQPRSGADRASRTDQALLHVLKPDVECGVHDSRLLARASTARVSIRARSSARCAPSPAGDNHHRMSRELHLGQTARVIAATGRQRPGHAAASATTITRAPPAVRAGTTSRPARCASPIPWTMPMSSTVAPGSGGSSAADSRHVRGHMERTGPLRVRLRRSPGPAVVPSRRGRGDAAAVAPDRPLRCATAPAAARTPPREATTAELRNSEGAAVRPISEATVPAADGLHHHRRPPGEVHRVQASSSSSKSPASTAGTSKPGSS